MIDPISGALMLAKFVPDIIKYFSGSDKAAEVAGQVISIAKTITGKDDPQDAMAALEADPALALQFKLAVMANETEIVKAHLNDVQSARAMQIAALGQDDLFAKRFVYWFAIGWSTFAMIYFAAVTFATIPAAGQRVADTILGVLISSVIGVMFSYFYGTTRTSGRKDETIKNLTR